MTHALRPRALSLAAAAALAACYASHERDDATAPDAAACIGDEHLHVRIESPGCDLTIDDCETSISGALGSAAADGDDLRIAVIGRDCTCTYVMNVGATLASQVRAAGSPTLVYVFLARDGDGNIVEARFDAVQDVGASTPFEPWIYLADPVRSDATLTPDGLSLSIGELVCRESASHTAHQLSVALPVGGPNLTAAPGETVTEPVHHLGRWILHDARTTNDCGPTCGETASDIAYVIARDIPW